MDPDRARYEHENHEPGYCIRPSTVFGSYYIKKLFKKDSTILPETKGIEKSIKSNDFLLKLFCRIFGSGSRKLKSWVRKK